MIHEGGYDIIELFSASKGMNQNIAPALLKQDYSYYIENMMPQSLGEGQVRYGTSEFSHVPTDKIIAAFPFSSESGAKQQVLYMNGFANFAVYTNFRIISSNVIRITSPDIALFKPDTLLKLNYIDLNGISSDLFYRIKSITSVQDHDDTIDIELEDNSFPDNLVDFYIEAVDPDPQYIDDSHFSITVPDDFIAESYYFDGQILELTIDGLSTDLLIAPNGINAAVQGQITFTILNQNVPLFDDGKERLLDYQSRTPELNTLFNSYGYIKVLDVATNSFLAATLDGLSVACVPRAEYFAKNLWIYNGVDDVMTWDGATLEVYEEQIKERAGSFNWIDAEPNRNFSFIPDASFDIAKYAVGKSIRLVIIHLNAILQDLTTT